MEIKVFLLLAREDEGSLLSKEFLPFDMFKEIWHEYHFEMYIHLLMKMKMGKITF